MPQDASSSRESSSLTVTKAASEKRSFINALDHGDLKGPLLPGARPNGTFIFRASSSGYAKLYRLRLNTGLFAPKNGPPLSTTRLLERISFTASPAAPLS